MRAITLGTEAIRMLLAGESIPIETRAPGSYWVKEMIRHANAGPDRWVYGAGGDAVEATQESIGNVVRWARAQRRARIPASHMPLMFSRFTIVVGEDGAATVHAGNIDRVPL